ncbi:hypothetical protein Clacol_008756 [Clathrus columnatus]|uniref:Nuclear control of ATPase protein 2 n=1 Tax=Clathrus columnatus TaxID=1419009 RepID=A0AAV5AIL4_9AGAM|nr:hypothetical protein Clacol_008756 [Clathrus columnatus]
MSTSTTIEKFRELCIRLESEQNVEIEATEYLENECSKNFQPDAEFEQEVNALVNLLTSRLYTRITDNYLREATYADDEASWWSYLEQSSHLELTWYLLQKSLRDDSAERLGKLVSLQPIYSQSNFKSSLPALFIITSGRPSSDTNDPQAQEKEESFSMSQPPSQLLHTLNDVLELQKNTFHSLLTPHLKPSTLTLTWPKLILVPSVTFILFRMIYTPGPSNISTYSMLKTTFFQIQSTAVGFWRNYLLEPLREILDTMRTGGSESTRLVNPQGVQADIESLHRMAISLTRDTYPHTVPSKAPQAYTPALDELTAQIMSGDLTPVLKIYESDLRSPLRSALTGSLIRSLLIQVQRMKVDLSTTLQSLDKLLHSQALTFALVGVAPSLVITYSFLSALRTFVIGANRRARFGGVKKRRAVWSVMRRIERILVYSETIPHDKVNTTYNNPQNTLPPLAQGHLLISLSHLRTFAHNHFPSYSSSPSKTRRNSPADFKSELAGKPSSGSGTTINTFSRIQKHSHRTEQNALAAFLSDIDDLSDPILGKDAKLRVVDRMWRNWGTLLGWGEMGGESWTA